MMDKLYMDCETIYAQPRTNRRTPSFTVYYSIYHRFAESNKFRRFFRSVGVLAGPVSLSLMIVRLHFICVGAVVIAPRV